MGGNRGECRWIDGVHAPRGRPGKPASAGCAPRPPLPGL